jgi:hypothetical protein
LDLGQLLDQLVESAVVEVELTLEGAERDAPVAFQERPGFLDGFQEAHRTRTHPVWSSPPEERASNPTSSGAPPLGLLAVDEPDPGPAGRVISGPAAEFEAIHRFVPTGSTQRTGIPYGG